MSGLPVKRCQAAGTRLDSGYLSASASLPIKNWSAGKSQRFLSDGTRPFVIEDNMLVEQNFVGGWLFQVDTAAQGVRDKLRCRVRGVYISNVGQSWFFPSKGQSGLENSPSGLYPWKALILPNQKVSRIRGQCNCSGQLSSFETPHEKAFRDLDVLPNSISI